MPTVDQPNAPKRLPSAEPENSFFRAWALRGSEGSNSTERLYATSDVSAPSQISPTTQVVDRKSRNTERRNNASESNISLISPVSWGPITPHIAPHCTVPNTVYEKPSFPHTRASTASGSSKDNTSSRSSISSRARRLLAIPTIRVTRNAKADGRPPLRARKGFKWKHETAGHWFESRVGKTGPNGTSHTGSGVVTPLVQVRMIDTPTISDDRNSIAMLGSSSLPSPKSFTTAANVGKDATSKANCFQTLSPPLPRDGLYCRTKRVLGLKNGPKVGTESESGIYVPERTKTGGIGEILERTSSVLRHFAEIRRLTNRARESTSPSTSTSNLSIAAPSAASHWQRLRPGLRSSTHSSSSSLQSLMCYKPPPPTPQLQAMYVGSDGKQYFAVELTDPDTSTFLPSEARRVKTPPLGISALGEKKLRGFFFAYNVPMDVDNSDLRKPESPERSMLTTGSRSESTPPLMRRPEKNLQESANVPKRVSDTEWYRVKINAIEADEIGEQSVLSVPEHLPSSPMCPRHPKNRSKGKGVCVYHGRNMSWSSTTVSTEPNPGSKHQT